MTQNIIQLFQTATAPLVLISGIGIYILTLNARYTHVIARVREIHDKVEFGAKNKDTLLKELDIIVRRCYLMKLSIGMLVSSTVCSGLLVIMAVTSNIIDLSFYYPVVILLLIACILIVGSMILFFIDITISLKATMIHIGKKDF